MKFAPGRTIELLTAMRDRTPLVHCITNYVAMDITANALLAAGASPAMIHAEEEAADFATIADALLINIGTLSADWVKSMFLAAERMGERGQPWVVDPVGAGATKYRTTVASDLASLHPTVIRGNASEIIALAGAEHATRGVDSVHDTDAALVVARDYAVSRSTIVAVTGAIDYVTDGNRTISISNGHPMMTLITAVGCAASALVAAFATVGDDPLESTAAALATIAVAGEIAAETAAGPGTLRLHMMDLLYTLGERDLARARVDWVE